MSAITLHPVKRATRRSNRFCGPSALSILTGLDTEDTARLLRSVSGRNRIRGTAIYHMRVALERLGFRVQGPPTSELSAAGRPTFAQWCRRERNPADTYLLVTGHHYVIVQGRRCCCGIMKVPTFIRSARKRRARVTEVLKVERVSEQQFTSLVPPKPVAPPRNPSSALAKRLAAAHGIKLESVSMYDRLNPEGDGVYVMPPDGLYPEDQPEADPLNGQRIAYSWHEVLANVGLYIEALKARQTVAATPASQS